MIVAALTVVTDGAVQKAITGSASSSQGGTAAKAPLPDGHGKPVQIEEVGSLDTGDYSTIDVSAKKIQLTQKQLAQLSDKYGTGALYRVWSSLPIVLTTVPYATGLISVTVTGNEKATATITGIHIVKQCEAPLTGTLFYAPPQGLSSTAEFGFDLGSSINYAQYEDSDGAKFTGNYFRDHVVTLGPDESQTFSIAIVDTRSFCDFTLQMTVATPSGVVTEEIEHGGKPFQISAVLTGRAGVPEYSRYDAVYVGGDQSYQNNFAWIQVNPRTYRLPPGNYKPQRRPPGLMHRHQARQDIISSSPDKMCRSSLSSATASASSPPRPSGRASPGRAPPGTPHHPRPALNRGLHLGPAPGQFLPRRPAQNRNTPP